MKQKAETSGNPNVLSFPDYVHPTHTALREGMKELGSDIEKKREELLRKKKRKQEAQKEIEQMIGKKPKLR